MKLGCTFLFLAVAGCSADVLVVDDKGIPIEGAIVDPMASSFNGPGIPTDESGKARLPMSLVQGWKWVGVTKRGYQGISNIELTDDRPMRVVLHPDSGQSAMILEYLDRDGKPVRRFLDIGSKGLETLLQSEFRVEPRKDRADREALTGILLVSEPEDFAFQRPPAKMYLLPRVLPPDSEQSVASPSPWSWLIGQFEYRGTPYNGNVSSGIDLP